ncbi:MAG: hypothetical protein Q9217_003304 [Psora testacea]
MSLYQIAIEYLLVYCTAVGLTAIGEPSLAKPPQSDPPMINPSEGKEPMPVWIVLIFVSLAAAKWIISFLIQYVYLVISTVIIVASTRIKTVDAANARAHESSQRAHLDQLIRTIRVMGAFKSAKADRLQRDERARRLGRVSVSEVKADLKRRSTLEASRPAATPKGPVMKAWQRVTSMACFRGFTPLLTISIAQWVLGFVTDFLLSGQPSELKLGYGTTSIVLKTVFASAYAVWTHYTITKPSNKKVFHHFPKGGEVLIELWPMTALWAVADQLCMSGPLALSRYFGLRKYAFDAESWNGLHGLELPVVVVQFAVVFLLYVCLVAFVSVPMTIMTRRVHASMLSDEDLAIVPFNRGDKARPHKFDQRSKIRRPGLTVSQAWATVTWALYFRVLKIYLQHFVINQLVQMAYWTANWKLHEVLEVDKYASTKLPWSPIGVIKSLNDRALPEMGDEDMPHHVEL